LFGERLGLFAYGAGGGYFGFLAGPESDSGGFASLHAGAGVAFQLLNDVSLFLAADYNAFLGTYASLSVGLGISTRLAGPGGGAVPLGAVTPLRPTDAPASGFIQIDNVTLDTVFPVLLKYYDTNSIGSARVTNIGEDVVQDVEIRVRPATYIDSPKLSARIDTLEPGESADVDLYVLFNEGILRVSESAKVVTDIEASYRVGNREARDVETVTLEAYDKNSLQWDDDARIAAFVTAKDEEIQRFAKTMAAVSRDAVVDAVSAELQTGMLLYSALVQQGLAYVVDPSSSYEVLSDNPLAIDFVQFPRQTLHVGAGDCDDLSVAYCTLLEAVGVETAFITVPGHIFAAFKLRTRPDDARGEFSRPEDLIIRGDSVWIPVETTLLGEGFLEAWATGARQWRTSSEEGRAEFFVTADAWKTYDPVAFSVSEIELALPARDAVLTSFQSELRKYVLQEIFPREKQLKDLLKTRPQDVRLLNSLGVLYARYGMYEEARTRFEAALLIRDYLPSLINAANLDYIESDLRSARDRYAQVLAEERENVPALLGIARIEHELENFGSAREAYQALRQVAPDIAVQYAYLGPEGAGAESGRASEAGIDRQSVLWQDTQ
jgi:tetratricopeptide (TPR) repeat protein